MWPGWKKSFKVRFRMILDRCVCIVWIDNMLETGAKVSPFSNMVSWWFDSILDDKLMVLKGFFSFLKVLDGLR